MQGYMWDCCLSKDLTDDIQFSCNLSSYIILFECPCTVCEEATPYHDVSTSVSINMPFNYNEFRVFVCTVLEFGATYSTEYFLPTASCKVHFY